MVQRESAPTPSEKKRGNNTELPSGAKVRGRLSSRTPHHERPQKPQGALAKLHNAFHQFARKASESMGSATAFVLAVTTIVLWAFCGPLFSFSETWQLVINTATTIVTFLMVFLIQHTQNHDAQAIHTKLDELLRAHENAHNDVIDLEELSEDELKEIQRRVRSAREERCDEINKKTGRSDASQEADSNEGDEQN